MNEPYNNLGNILATRGEHAAALAMYEKALDLEPTAGAGEINANIADTYIDMGMAPAAQAALERALEYDPANGRYHLELGRALRMQGDDGAAQTAIERAIALEPAARRSHAELADLHRVNGRFGEAISSYERALAIDSTYARALFGLAISLDSAAEPSAAATAYGRFLQVWSKRDANHERALTRLQELTRE